MVAATRTTRAQWVDAGLTALSAGGPEAVRVEVLAAQLGVTKGGFYGQFADRQTFLVALLDTWERETTSDVRHRVAAEGGDARHRLLRADILTFSGHRLLPVDLAVREWARREPDVAARLRRVDEERMAYLRELFAVIVGPDGGADVDADEVEARSLLAFCLAIGHHFLTAGHGDRSRDSVLRWAVRILERPEAG